ncbi:hypothetical protein ACVU03_11230 [Bacillus safensis]
MENLQSILNSFKEIQKKDPQLFRAVSRSITFSNFFPGDGKIFDRIILAEKLYQLTKNMDKVSLKKELDRISILPNKFDIPNIPEVDLSEFNDRLDRITRHNTSLGWTLPEEMPMNHYLRGEYLNMKQGEVDQIFVSFYEDNEYHHLKILINALQDGLSEKWKVILEQTLELYLKGNIEIAIPALIAIIEGELSIILGSEKYGKGLLKDFEDKLDNTIQFLTISAFSAYYFFKEHLFKNHDFSDTRLPVLNRNWILHGRDDPSAWKKEDVLKLLNTLSTLKLFKESDIA